MPRNTPKETAARLTRDINGIFSSPEMIEELAKRGIIANPGSPDELAALLKKELFEWKKIVDNGNIVAD